MNTGNAFRDFDLWDAAQDEAERDEAARDAYRAEVRRDIAETIRNVRARCGCRKQWDGQARAAVARQYQRLVFAQMQSFKPPFDPDL